MSSFFRPEALEAQRQSWLGNITLVRPLSLTVLTVGAAALLASASAFLWVGEYTRKARVSGYLVPDRGVIRLVSPQPATVVESQAVEGRAVLRGDVLFVLALDPATLAAEKQAIVQGSVTTRERSLQGAAQQRAQLEQERLAAIDRQVEGMRLEVAQIDSEARLQKQRLDLARQAQARLESLRDENFVSAAQVQAKAEEVLGLQAQMQALERQRAGHLREMATLQSQRREIPLQARAEQGEIERDLASLAQQSAERDAGRRIVVRAPQDGTVTGVIAQVGHSVSPTAALASLVPSDARMQAHLFAPSSAVGFVRPEQPVNLRYQAFPYQKFGHQSGQVAQVSRSPLQVAELAALPMGAPAGGAEPLYRITVTLDRQSVLAYGQAHALAPGMQIDADVLLDRRRLIEWIFEPVLGMAGRV